MTNNIIEINRVKPNEKNPRKKYDREDLEILKESMRTIGQLTPIIIDENNIILAGHRRLQSAKELGWKTIKYQREVGLSTFKKSAILISSNSTHASFNAWEMRDAISRIYWEEFLEEYSPTSNVDKGYSAFAKSIGISISYVKQIVESALPENKKLLERAKSEDLDVETYHEILTAKPSMRKELLEQAISIKKKEPNKKGGVIRDIIKSEKRKARIKEGGEVSKSTIKYLIKKVEVLNYEFTDDIINKSNSEDLDDLMNVLEKTFVSFYFRIKKMRR
jgi:ParB family chromosome partitioning protein